MKNTEIQEQIILGTLLGDAYIGKLKNRGKTYRIEWEHCLKQESYAIWKADNSLNNYSIFKRSRLDDRTNKTYSSIKCYSIKEDYRYYRELFYKNKKEVSLEILNKLKPLGIAVWYMDDGSLYYNGSICHLNLAINGFENRDLIINWFKTNYDLNFKSSGKSIRLTSKKECEKFMNVIKDYIHEDLKYKLLSEALLNYKNSLSKEKLNRRWKINR